MKVVISFASARSLPCDQLIIEPRASTVTPASSRSSLIGEASEKTSSGSAAVAG